MMLISNYISFVFLLPFILNSLTLPPLQLHFLNVTICFISVYMSVCLSVYALTCLLNMGTCVLLQTSSQIDLKKFADTDRPVSAKSNRSVTSRQSVLPDKSRPSSSDSKQAMIVKHSSDSGQPPSNGDIYAITPIQNRENEAQSPVQTKEEMELKEIESVGGDSTYGSQAMLLGPPNNNVDADSGIHSTQGLTPTIPSDPSFPSYIDGDDDQAKRNSILVHLKPGEHHPHLNGHHDSTESKGSALTTSGIKPETEDELIEEVMK